MRTELGLVHRIWSRPLDICGDFNIMHFALNRKGTQPTSSCAKDWDLSKMIWALIDTPLIGVYYS
ncbi:hypothetical protein DVA81_18890, partial [Acinetobacter baumannii]